MISQKGELVVLEVKARPGSKREGLELVDDQLIVKVSAPPVDGKANERIVEVVAKALGVKKRQVRIARGETARRKVLEVEGTTREAVLARITQP